MTKKIWANSGDSHFIEPADLWTDALPPKLADLMPRSVKSEDGTFETVYVDGKEFTRKMPKPAQEKFFRESSAAQGARDVSARMPDLDQEGIWAEVVFPSLGMWNAMFTTREALAAACSVSNDWAKKELVDRSPRLLPTAQVSMINIDDAIAELHRSSGLGFKSVFLPTTPPKQIPDYNDDAWEPFWQACEDTNMVVAFHIGTDPLDMAAGQAAGQMYRGPGGAVLNYTETTFSGQRAAMKMVASGALDRHPSLKVLVSEGGASWVPFMVDRMVEGYRQHHMMVRPKLQREIKDIVYSQIYASFQHDESAVGTMTTFGYNNVMWGSDYPHMEGTYGHTQDTLHHLFDGVDEKVTHRITQGAFLELFPDTPACPAA